MIEIGGREQGETYDLLVVTGEATLGGRLSVSVLEGFDPTSRHDPEPYFVLEADEGIAGEFTNAPPSGRNGQRALTTDGQWSFAVDYGPESRFPGYENLVMLSDFRPAAWGDANCDGAVDTSDQEAFLLAVGDPDEYEIEHPDCDMFEACDLNEDGYVDELDIAPFLALLPQAP